jgi:hypothetical protein
MCAHANWHGAIDKWHTALRARSMHAPALPGLMVFF